MDAIRDFIMHVERGVKLYEKGLLTPKEFADVTIHNLAQLNKARADAS